MILVHLACSGENANISNRRDLEAEPGAPGST